jgi:chromosome segregation ATPase
MTSLENLHRENSELQERVRELSASVEVQTRRADLALERGEMQAREAQEHIRALEDRVDSWVGLGRERELKLVDTDGLLRGKTTECALLEEKLRTQTRKLKEFKNMISVEDKEGLEAEVASAQEELVSVRTAHSRKEAEQGAENERLHGLLSELETLERGGQESTVGLWRKEKEAMLTSMGLLRAETKRQQLHFESRIQGVRTEHEAERRGSEAQIRQLMLQLNIGPAAASTPALASIAWPKLPWQ